MASYQSILSHEFVKRTSKNPSYSLRGFARDLGLSQSFLSQVLNKKRNLSDEKALIIAEKLKLTKAQKNLFLKLVRLEHSQLPETKQILKSEIDHLLQINPNLKFLPEDVFNIISDWYYFAILELTALKDFKSDVRWISRKLKLPIGTTIAAISRLERVGLLSVAGGDWKKVEKDYIFANISSEAIRKHHHETLDLAHKALEEQDMKSREFYTASFTIDPKRIEEVKNRIHEFSQQLMVEMQETEPKAVYKLAVQFFRLDQENV